MTGRIQADVSVMDGSSDEKCGRDPERSPRLKEGGNRGSDDRDTDEVRVIQFVTRSHSGS